MVISKSGGEHNNFGFDSDEDYRFSVNQEVRADNVRTVSKSKKWMIPSFAPYLGGGALTGAAAGGISCGILLNTTNMSTAKLSVESAGGATVVVTAVLGAIAGGIIYKAAGASRV